MKRTQDSNTEMNDVLLRELGKSACPDEERFHQNFLSRLEREHVRPVIEREPDVPWHRTIRFRLAYAATFCVILLAVGAYWTIFSTKPIATVAVALGEVSTSNASTKDRSIYAGDIVQSHASSQASLLLADHSLIRLDEQSSLKLIERRKIQLLEGRLFAEVSPMTTPESFQITAKYISIVVLGTSFEVDSQESQTIVTVFRGSVRVDWNGQSKTLTAGDSLSISTNDRSSHTRMAETGIPKWAEALRKAESNNPILQAMQEHFPSRSLDVRTQP